MSKHMRFVVTVLFAVILLLTAAITKFYSNTGKSTGGGSDRIDMEKKLGSDLKGNRIFMDSSGLYGVIDSNEHVVVDPEWLDLSFAGEDLCMVSKSLKGEVLTGCIDFEGNVTVPMIYREIVKHSHGSFVFYTAYTASDNSCILYDEEFHLLFPRSWNNCSFTEDELSLTDTNGTYTYSVDYTGLSLKRAVLQGTAFDCEYELKIYSENLLSALDPDMLDKICADSGKYIEFAFTGSREYLSDVRSEDKSVFTTIFPDDKKILSKKLTGISNMLLYPMESDDGKPHYAVVMVADAEIAYTDDEDKPQTLNGHYKAFIEFCGDSSNDLAAISGNFVQNSPDYPKPQAADKNPESQDDTVHDETAPGDGENNNQP